MRHAQDRQAEQESIRTQLSTADSLSTFDAVWDRAFRSRYLTEALVQEIQQARADWYVRTHADLLPIVRDAIQQHRLLVGMTAEQVHASWGKPRMANPSLVDVGGTHEQWIYQGRTCVYLDNAVLSAWQGEGHY